ncbi:MAG: hypothetical protein AB7S70_02090 [Hyphomicrobium sp.]|uniref:hypothetical protein n=1 Tax=Hyphomicrobium sp. TaxID=82 RepID=UPI003D0BEC79
MSPDRNATPSPDAGFGMVEAVVALALMAIIVALTTNALNASRRTLKMIQSQGDHTSVAASLRYVEQRLADAQPLYEKRLGNEASIHFRGEPDRVTFLSAVEGSAEASGGLYVVEFGRLGSHRAGLELRMTPYLPNRRDVARAASERDLGTALSHFEIGYFGLAPNGGPAMWQDSWLNRAALPFAVRVKAKRSGKAMEQIYIPLRLGRALTDASNF